MLIPIFCCTDIMLRLSKRICARDGRMFERHEIPIVSSYASAYYLGGGGRRSKFEKNAIELASSRSTGKERSSVCVLFPKLKKPNPGAAQNNFNIGRLYTQTNTEA